MTLDLKLYPENEDILTIDCDPVDDLENQQDLIDDMIETVKAHEALGLAAPQIGVAKNITVVRFSEGTYKTLVNPEITHFQGEVESQEGCLSFPGLTLDIERAAAVKYEYMDREGEEHEDDAHGLLSTIIQHEVDHLNGTLFIDHLSELKHRVEMKKYRKIRKKLTRGDYVSS